MELQPQQPPLYPINQLKEVLQTLSHGGVLWGATVDSQDEEQQQRLDNILQKFLVAANGNSNSAGSKLVETIDWRVEQQFQEGCQHEEAVVAPLQQHWTVNVFENTCCCTIDVTRWAAQVQPNHRRLTPHLVKGIERCLHQLPTNVFKHDGTPSILLVLKLSGGCNLALTRNILTAVTSTVHNYPNFFLGEIYVGGSLHRHICKWNGKLNVTSSKHAYWKLLQFVWATQFAIEWGGFVAIEDEDIHRRYSRSIDVLHGKRGAIKIQCDAGMTLNLVAYVIQWEVRVTIVFFPLRNNSYPILLLRKHFKAKCPVPTHNRIVRQFFVPLDGNVMVTVENSSFSPKKLVVICNVFNN